MKKNNFFSVIKKDDQKTEEGKTEEVTKPENSFEVSGGSAFSSLKRVSLESLRDGSEAKSESERASKLKRSASEISITFIDSLRKVGSSSDQNDDKLSQHSDSKSLTFSSKRERMPSLILPPQAKVAKMDGSKPENYESEEINKILFDAKIPESLYSPGPKAPIRGASSSSLNAFLTEDIAQESSPQVGGSPQGSNAGFLDEEVAKKDSRPSQDSLPSPRPSSPSALTSPVRRLSVSDNKSL